MCNILVGKDGVEIDDGAVVAGFLEKVENSKSVEELVTALEELDRMGFQIKGSSKNYAALDMRDRILECKDVMDKHGDPSGSLFYKFVTRSFGLRAKLKEILKRPLTAS